MNGAPIQKLRTILVVTFVTVLIWAFAEGQSLQAKRTVAEIEFPSASAEPYVVHVLDNQNWRGRVELLVEGSTTSLEALESALRTPIVLEPGVDGVPRESGEHTINLRDALRSQPAFQARGVTVISADPPTIRVHIEEMATRQIDILVEVPQGEIEGTASPVGFNQASVRLPARVAEQLSGEASLLARVRPEDLARLEPGRRVILPNVRLEPGPELADVQNLVITPAQVDVQLTVRSTSETYVVPSVSVDVRIPPDLLNVWIIEIPQEEQAIRDVRVTGPSELIQRVRNQELPITAFIRLTYSDLELGATAARVEFTSLPSQLTVESEDREVRFTARRRSETTSGADLPGS